MIRIGTTLNAVHGFTSRGRRQITGEADNQYVRISGLVQAIPVTAFAGNADWIYTLTGGHWYTGPDQAVVAKSFLTTLHLTLGDTVTIIGSRGRKIPVRSSERCSPTTTTA
jgi:hypothetical protein